MATICWSPSQPTDMTGVFSFACFFSNPLPPKAEAYIGGLTRYRDVCKLDAWAGWKIVVYTDNATLNQGVPLGSGATADAINAYRARLNELFTDPVFHIATVSWPEFTGRDEKMDWQRLICFRYKAFYDFPDAPVLVRDADTIFLNDATPPSVRKSVEEISNWELAYLKGLRGTGKLFSLATMPQYTRKNLGGANGFFGGTVGSLGGIKEWMDGSLWESCVSYISNKEHNPIRDVKPPLDVAILNLVIYPVLKDRTFLLKYEFPADPTPAYVLERFAIKSFHEELVPLFEGGQRRSRRRRSQRRSMRRKRSARKCRQSKS